MANKENDDQRIDNLQTDVRELRSENRDMAGDITEIREKLNNGLTTMVTEMHTEMLRMREAANKIEHYSDAKNRLNSCPMKDYIEEFLRKKILITATIITVVIGTASFLGALFGS